MHYDYVLTDIEGSLCYGNYRGESRKVLDFKIANRQLVSYYVHPDATLPGLLTQYGISKLTLDAYFEGCVVEYGAMNYLQYCHDLGLPDYDFTKLVIINYGIHGSLFWFQPSHECEQKLCDELVERPN